MDAKIDPLHIESSAGKTFVCIVFFTFVAAALWCTPLPNAPEESCNRPCHELEWPRICRFEFTIESHAISESSCTNQTEFCFEDEFNYESGNKFSTVNRQIPGPAIQVCLHDIVVVNVENRIPDQNVAIHWRGQAQASSPLMDGVPMVTQCPTPSFTTFQYKFRASNVGTHTWHLYNGENGILNNIYGMLVVRESVRKEVHQKLMDNDQSSHTILLRSLKNSLQAMILINGRHPSVENRDTGICFDVSKNKRYRFRLIHNGGSNKCPIICSIERHKMLVIALDGNSVEPFQTNQFIFVAGERIDFIIWANQDEKEFDIKFISAPSCDTKSVSIAKLRYINNNSTTFTPSNPFSEFTESEKFSTVAVENDQKILGLHNVKVVSNLQPNILQKNADVVHYLYYGHRNIYWQNIKKKVNIAHINNITFKYPSSPLASQIEDVPINQICNKNELPQNCFQGSNTICECTHVINVERGSVLDVVLIHQDQNPEKGHIFHLHGSKFYLLNRLSLSDRRSISDVEIFDGTEKLKRNLEKPILKDTVWIPPGGLAVIRFLAENAGYWMLREEESEGMEIVFNVFGSQFDVPDSFPRCGNFVGPKYFLA